MDFNDNTRYHPPSPSKPTELPFPAVKSRITQFSPIPTKFLRLLSIINHMKP